MSRKRCPTGFRTLTTKELGTIDSGLDYLLDQRYGKVPGNELSDDKANEFKSDLKKKLVCMER